MLWSHWSTKCEAQCGMIDLFSNLTNSNELSYPDAVITVCLCFAGGLDMREIIDIGL